MDIWVGRASVEWKNKVENLEEKIMPSKKEKKKIIHKK